MAPGRLGRGGESDCGPGFEAVPRAPELGTGSAALRPPGLSHLRAGGLAGVPPCAAGARAGPTCPLPLPSPLPASAPARRSQEAGTCHLLWASPSCLGRE